MLRVPSNTLREKQKLPVYSVCFNCIDPASEALFAACGGRRVTIYECKNKPRGAIEPVQGYQDESTEEEFYAVAWSVDRASGAPMLLAAGRRGVLRVLDCHRQALLWTAVGHGDPINDISVHPTKPELALTASKDHAVRLWNVRTQACVLMVHGDGGHTNEVISVAFNPTDPSRFVSCGLDSCVKLWSLQRHGKDVEAADAFVAARGRAFRAGCLAHPAFSTQKVHQGRYVDCARWLGDLILSKSVDSRILLWRPAPDARAPVSNGQPRLCPEGRVQLIQEFCYEGGENIWFLRFAMDPRAQVLACGNGLGRVFVWSLAREGADVGRASAVLSVGSKGDRAKAKVRHVAVSASGGTILACCDDAAIHRFDSDQ